VSRASQIGFLSRTAPLYDAVVRAMGFPGLWHKMVAIADPAPGMLCLDACTGTAGVALGLAARGARVVGLDLAGGMLARAQRKSRDRRLTSSVGLVRMDARRLGFADRQFPLVTCCMALHEMGETEREAVLSELCRVGRARVLVADYRVPVSRLGRAVFRLGRAFEFLESDDFGSFIAREMPQRLEKAGLRIEGASNAGYYRIWHCRAPS
jgi:ubiquinone/menaquinone biosynthesis C-methylase UbiE